MKKILLLVLIVVFTTGAKGCLQTGLFGGLTNFWGTGNNAGADFVLDNDAVFDLFQDDFGTGTQYDDRFIDSGGGDANVADTDVSADGEVEYTGDTSYTFDPEYDKIGKMTPDELHPIQTMDIPALTLGGNLFPFPDKQFGDMAVADLCDHPHYHGATGYTLDRKNIPEPSNPCGFDDATKIISVTGDEMIEWFHNRPRNF